MRRLAILATVLRKDLMLFSRDWLFLALTIASVTMFVVLYYVLPANVQPAFSLGVRGAELRPVLTELAGGEGDGVPLEFYDSGEELRAAVEAGDLEIGIDFPNGMVGAIAAGEAVSVDRKSVV